ncbi:MAG: EAL domain-containing protein, partial [Gammaproteobacteria bacterium]|nr:EAL domain-containing protein [Gammaproteobacteria bacterium]
GKGIRGFRADDMDVFKGKSLHNPYDPATFSDGSFHVFDTLKTPLSNTSGIIYAVLGISRDVTERLDLETKLHQAATVYDNSSEGIIITDANANIVAVNKAFSLITGYAEQEVLGQNLSMLASGEHDQAFFENMWHELQSTDHWRGEIINRHKEGHLYPEWKTISAVKNNDGLVTNYVSNFSDISEFKKSEEALKYMAQHDQLTQLPNRNLLIFQLEQAIYRAKRNNTIIALLFLDLDNFKQINDTLGHSVGDRVLKDVAHKFKMSIREEDILSRQGGDEFLVLLEELHDGQEASIIAQKLIDSLKDPISISDHDFYIGVSIGISLFPDDGLESEQLIKNADSAMYQSKNGRKNRYSFFTPQLNQYTERRFTLENHLRSALTKNEIYVAYQPQIDINTHQIYGFESLIRWEHPQLGVISPDEFIPIAESIGLINEVGQFVLQESIRQIQYWNKKYATSLCVSVNVSSRQFEDSELPELINSLLTQNHCAPQCLKIEITESLLLQDNVRILDMLTTISNANISIALDDFGTGYSSLSYLKKFPIDIVKIDQSFIGDITKDTEDAILVKTIITMANGLRMETIAEGVETIEQLNFLEIEGCRLIQGNYYSQALRENEVEDFILNWK